MLLSNYLGWMMDALSWNSVLWLTLAGETIGLTWLVLFGEMAARQ